MKSNEEFIAGIYEKAAAYEKTAAYEKAAVCEKTAAYEKAAVCETEGKNKPVLPLFSALRTAAMLVMAVGLLGAGAGLLGKLAGKPQQSVQEMPEPAMLFYELGEEHAVGPLSRAVSEEYRKLIGTVTTIDREKNMLWITLNQETDSDIQPDSEQSIAIQWTASEKLPSVLAPGQRLKVEGTVSSYPDEASVQLGATLLIVSEMQKISLWMEEEQAYRTMDSLEHN